MTSCFIHLSRNNSRLTTDDTKPLVERKSGMNAFRNLQLTCLLDIHCVSTNCISRN